MLHALAFIANITDNELIQSMLRSKLREQNHPYNTQTAQEIAERLSPNNPFRTIFENKAKEKEQQKR